MYLNGLNQGFQYTSIYFNILQNSLVTEQSNIFQENTNMFLLQVQRLF